MRIHIHTTNFCKTAKQVAGKVLPMIGYAILGYTAMKMRNYYGGNYTNINVDFPFDDPFETAEESPKGYSTYYGRTVNAIMNSSMFSDDKRIILEYLKENKDIGYYEAIIAIVNGTMCSTDKRVAICNLSK